MKIEAPPGRYRIVERNRRLVTIDTHIGTEIGVSAAMAGASAQLSRTPDAPRAEIAPPRGSSRPSALGPVAAPARPAKARFDPGRTNRIIILAVAIVVVATILIVTNTWFLLVVPFLIPQVRQTVWPKLKTAAIRYIDQAGSVSMRG